MSRTYRRLSDDRRAVLVEFHPRWKQTPSRYVMAWADTGETFQMDGRRLLAEFEHVEDAAVVEAARR